jgi:hypothetical protein
MSDKIEETRRKAAEIIANAKNVTNAEVAEQYNANLKEFLAAGGSKSDMIVRIGEQMFDFFLEGGLNDRSKQGPHEDEPIEGSIRLDFDYLEKFMIDAFEAVGVPSHEARVSANVLIEADKRGIDSHGIGRLKPIYFDRIKNGILQPYKPIDVIKETSTTALVDGNMGLGLYIGPYCMEMAIKKAKQHGVGFVVAKNSTHYGIAGKWWSSSSVLLDGDADTALHASIRSPLSYLISRIVVVCSRLLRDDGHGRGLHRLHGHERPPQHRAHLWRRALPR